MVGSESGDDALTIERLGAQIAALRELAAVHSPGTASAHLQRQQTSQLAELLRTHRDELRALLNGAASPVDVLPGDVAPKNLENDGTEWTAATSDLSKGWSMP